ncbi:MAG: patatin-like phospholipase family protein [Thermomicrobiales bacterium]
MTSSLPEISIQRIQGGAFATAIRRLADASTRGATSSPVGQSAGDQPQHLVDSQGAPSSDPDAQPLGAINRDRALVLGGGGALGNAWVIGVIAGILDAGTNVTDADLIIGTSSGSTAAAQIMGDDPLALHAAILSAPMPDRRPPAPATSSQVATSPPINHLQRTSEIIAAAHDLADMRQRLCASAMALDASADGTGSERWRATVAARLPDPDWPRRALWITAVDARTCESVVFDRQSGVGLADAVAASCSSGEPFRIGDERFIDGGYRRSSDNADLAAGHARVLVLSPFGGRSRAPLAWGMHLDAQAAELRAGGSAVETILPDENARIAFGTSMIDLSRRVDAARAGYAQGRATAPTIRAFWS